MSLTLEEARTRAGRVSDVAYDLDLDVGDGTLPRFRSRTTVRFTASAPETFLELQAAEDVSVSLDGKRVDAAYDGGRVALRGLGGTHEVVVEATLPFVTDGEGMHVVTDPADGEVYVSALLGMDIAQRVFACFDQNDLKAPVTLAVTADPRWTVVGNGRGTPVAAGRWEFAPTPPIPVAMVVLCAGPWTSYSWEHDGIPFGWHARRSLEAELRRDATELVATTEACFDEYARLFTVPYPFDSYDQVFVTGHNWGALESPGCVTFRDEYLPRGRITDGMRTTRATIIAHEMAHMWFGDLVTMTWWEDTWLQESFAEYMGYRVAEQGAGFADTLVDHELRRKVMGYECDQRRSTHAVAARPEDVPDVGSAATIFDMISYAKGNAVLRQLVVWLGDDVFLAGVNAYLSRHAYGNTTLHDFLTALDGVSDRDVHAWAQGWLLESGFDTIHLERDGDVPVLRREGHRPHRIGVSAFEGSEELGHVLVDVGAEPVALPDWAGRVVVPNSRGETFAQVRLDVAGAAWASASTSGLGDALTRCVLWATAFDRVRSRELSPGDYLDLVARQLPDEPNAEVVQGVLARTLRIVVPRRVPADGAASAVAAVAETCRAGLVGASTEALRLAFAAGLAETSSDVGLLSAWLANGALASGEDLHPELRWSVVHRLASLDAVDEDGIAAERRADGTLDGELGSLTALAALPHDSTRQDAWAALSAADVSNRHFQALTDGLWSLERADELGPYVDRYLAEAPRWADRGQGFASTVGAAFPLLALQPAHLATIQEALTRPISRVLARRFDDMLDEYR